MQVRQQGRPYAFQSVLLVCGLLLMYPALLTLADVLGADFDQFPAGAVVWTSLALAGAALYPAIARRSSICALIAGLAFGAAGLAFVDWVLDASSVTTYRWVLLVATAGYAVASLLLRRSGAAAFRADGQRRRAGGARDRADRRRAGPGRHARPVREPAAGHRCPTAGSSSCFAIGCGLVAYGAVDRAPGPAYLGVANLLAFVFCAGFSDQETLLYWPALILALGLGVMVAGLRPRAPLPPEPNPYTTGKVPLASRSGEEPVLRVRDDSPPS